jgi:hypothetical protein
MQAPLPYLARVRLAFRRFIVGLLGHFVFAAIGLPLALAITVLLGWYVLSGEAAFISFLLLILAEMWAYDRYRLWAYDRYRQWRASKKLGSGV